VGTKETWPQRSQAVASLGYQKHNMITDSAPVATQIMHAPVLLSPGKLRKLLQLQWRIVVMEALESQIFSKA